MGSAHIGVRDHFRLGGAQHFLPEFLIFARKVEYVWAMHFCLTKGSHGGGGGGEQLFWSDWVWDTTEGEGVEGEADEVEEDEAEENEEEEVGGGGRG